MKFNLPLAVSAFLCSSALVTLSAQTPTTTSLTASPNPVTFGGTLTLTASVTPNTVAGDVTFYNGVLVLGNAPLSNGVAQLSTVFLPAGSQTVSARYDGVTGVSNPSSSSPVLVSVTAGVSGSLTNISQFAVGNNISAVAAGDFNRDGKPDLVVANQSTGSVSVYLGAGGGSFLAGAVFPTSRPTALIAGDFNRDGKPDFAVVESSASDVRIYLGNGDGTFAVGTAAPVGTLPLGLTAADFNNDGILDLATSNLGNNDVSVLLGNGDGTFQTAVSTPVSGYLNLLAVGDFNGDGKPDIAVAIFDQQAVDVFLGNGDGTFQPVTQYTVGSNPYGVIVGDFNGDGKADLVVSNSGTETGVSTISVLIGNGNGTFQNAATISGFSAAQAIAAGDFNGDGKLDIVVGNATGSTINVLTGTGTGAFNPPAGFNAGSAPSALAVADFNGDGKTDVAVGDLNAPNGQPNLLVLAGAPPAVNVIQGNSQVASTGAAFAVPLEVQVVGFGVGVAGTPVTFTAPSSGPSGTFAGGAITAVVNTDVNGYATAPAFTANGIVGTYQVTASAQGGTVAFSLTNNSSSCTFTFTPSTISLDGNGGTVPVSVVPSSPSCSYGVTSTVNWIVATPSSGVGTSTVTITVSPYTGGTADRSGSVSIGGQSLPVTQDFTVEQFTDVLPSAYYFDAVNLLAAHGITNGCTPTQFCPTSNVTRDQMAIFIVRTVYNGNDNFTYNPVPYFTDVTPTTFGFKWIQKLYELGITTGCAPDLYCPTDTIRRDQMAVFIIRARYGSATAFTYPSAPYFTDVAPGQFGFQWIQRMKEDNITTGCTPTTYCPANTVTRGDMAIFVMRGGFNQLLPAGTPLITAVSPATLTAGTSATFTVTGVNTNFVQGVTAMVPIGGITPSNLIVLSPTEFTVTLTAASTAAIQPESVYVQTEPQEAVLPNSINVVAPAP